MKNTLSSKDWVLLSSYLDDQLDPKSRSKLEERLSHNSDLQKGLDELRRTRTVLRAAPQRKVPRNFILTPEMVQKTRPFSWLVPAFSFSSAVAAILAIVLISFELLPGMRSMTINAAPMLALKEADQAVALEAEPATQEEAPNIIFWNSPGMGGGQSVYDGVNSESSVPMGIGGGEDNLPPATIMIAPTEPMVEKEMPSATDQVAEEMAQPTSAASVEAEIEPTQLSLAENVEKSEETAGNSQADSERTYTSSSPILGIQPTRSDFGEYTITSEGVSENLTKQIPSVQRIAAGISGILAVVLAITAWIIWRRTHR